MIYKVSDFGAVGDGITNDTVAIQSALDACTAAGGGTVWFDGGHIYRSGYIRIRSNTELHLEMGAVLKATDSFDDLLPEGGHFEVKLLTEPTYSNCEYAGGPRLKFVHALDAENICISGMGTIDGNEKIFYGEQNGDHIDGSFYPRAPLLYIENVSHFTMKGLTLRDSAFWTVHMVGCKDVLIDGIRILNNRYLANCDGIDPDHCENVRISNCYISCADDCIVFKNTLDNEKYGPCRDITVSNCNLRSTSAAIKFGSESEALFTNILVSNCTISDSNRGISLQLRDKGSIENVVFSNINIETHLFQPIGWWGKAEPIAITANRRKSTTDVGYIKNVIFENINAVSENGILLFGDSEKRNISNIRFKDVTLRLRRSTDYTPGAIDTRPNLDNLIKYGKLEYVHTENVEAVSFENMSCTADEEMKKYM